MKVLIALLVKRKNKLDKGEYACVLLWTFQKLLIQIIVIFYL